MGRGEEMGVVVWEVWEGMWGCWFPHRYIVMCFFLSLFAMLLVGGAYDPFRSGPEDHHPGGDIPWCKSEIDTLNT